MASVAPSGGGGGTGFLFGNIDRRGRLDEDYMDDDAKDAIDNVAPTVTEGDRNLVEITNALPGRRSAGADRGDDDDDYDDEGSAPPNDPRVDYFNEEDELRDDGIDDEAQRARMAQIALGPLAKKKPVADEDDDYDEDDEPAPAAGAPALPPPAVPVPAGGAPAAAQPAGAPASAAAAPAAATGESRAPAPSEEDVALALQRRLMEEAKRGRDMMAQRAVVVDDSKLPPLRFSRIFTEPVKRIDMTKARPRSYGVRLENDAPNLETVEDDNIALEKPPPVPRFDPVSYFLAQDRANIAAAEAAQRARAKTCTDSASPRDPVMADFETAAEASDEEQASRPLDPTAQVLSTAKIPESAHVPVEQLAWEDDIVWGDNESDSEESEEDEAEQNSMVIDSGAGAGSAKSPAQVDSDSDDDDEWEDVEMADAPKPAPPVPVSLRSAPSPLKVPLSKPAPEKVPASQPHNPLKPSIPSSIPLRSKPALLKPALTSKPAAAAGKKAGKRKEDAGVKDKKVSFAKDLPTANGSEAAPTKNDEPAEPYIPVQYRPTSEFINQILRPNRDLVNGSWVDDVMWDSGSSDAEGGKKNPVAGRFSKLILDMNDTNMIFENISDTPSQESKSPTDTDVQARLKAQKMLMSSRLTTSDPFNISNDMYYSTGGTSNQLKVDRRSLLRGLHNAPPAVKCQTTKSVIPEEALRSWHRPKIPKDFITDEPVELLPFRRRRPKGGSAQIAGQVPKKRSELYCSSKDAYRVALFEYALEKKPVIMPIPGTASKILTFERKKSAEAAEQALKNVAGTPEADTVFLPPDENPPLHAGDIEIDGPPLSIMESHIFAAPCVRQEVPTTDFLVVRRGGKMHVREIDSVISIGVTEPKLDVMAPNTDRFKKFVKDRVSLFIIREFMKQQKKDYPPDVPRPLPSIDKESIFKEFSRRRTYPETALVKMLKELAKYQNGRYILSSEPAKGFAAREAEILRTITAEEMSAFESMEAGWEILHHAGIHQFTHPTSQGNLIQGGENLGVEAGPAVGAFMKHQLLQSPWYRSQVIHSAIKAQKKEMTSMLNLASIVNDLRQGGEVMESRLMSLQAGDLQNVLINHFRILLRKVPDDIEERRQLVREYTVKKTKGSEPMDYPTIIKTVLTKHRNHSQRNASHASGSNKPNAQADSFPLIIPLEIQRDALERGIVDKLPTEVKRTQIDLVAKAAAAVSSGPAAFAAEDGAPNPHKSNMHNRGSLGKKPRTSKKAPLVSSAKPPKNKKEADEQAELQKLAKSSAVAGGPSRVSSAKPPLRAAPENLTPLSVRPPRDTPQSEPKKKIVKKRPTRLRVTKKEVGADGVKRPVVTYITDPAEIEKMMAKEEQRNSGNRKVSQLAAGSPEAPGGERKVKISIGLHKLSKGGKAGVKKKASGSADRKKLAGAIKKGESAAEEGDGAPKLSSSVRKVGEKGHIGKIRINTKQMKKEKEEAAQKRLKNQYAEEDDYRARKSSKSGVTSRKKRNGIIPLNSILEKIEKAIRATEGYVADVNPMKIARLRLGEKPPSGIIASNLATPAGTALDLTQPVDVKKVPKYKDIVKKPMDLGLMREKCKKMQYLSAKDFLADMNQIVENARAFNTSPDVQWVVQHSVLLYEVAVEQVRDKSEEIQSAQELIAQQREENNLPAPEAKKKKRKKGSSSKAAGGAGGNGSRKKQKTGNGARTADGRPAAEGELQPLTPGRAAGPSMKSGLARNSGSKPSGSKSQGVKIPLSKPISSRSSKSPE